MVDLFLPDTGLLTMPAISLWQPWGSLPFAVGRFGFIKKHETRHWRYPASAHGKRTLIHAAKNKSEVCERPCNCSWCEACGEYPFGAFVGSVILGGCFRSEDCETDEDDRAAGNFGPGRFAWRMDDPQKLAEPIPAIGRQGFWNVEIDPAALSLPAKTGGR